MSFPKANKINAEKYVAGLSLFKQKVAKVKLSANESALGPSPKAIQEYKKVANNFKRYPDSDGTFLRKLLANKSTSYMITRCLNDTQNSAIRNRIL